MKIINNQPSFGMALKKPDLTFMNGEEIKGVLDAFPTLIERAQNFEVETSKGFVIESSGNGSKALVPVYRVIVSKKNKTIFEKILHVLGLLPTGEAVSKNTEKGAKNGSLSPDLIDTFERASKNYIAKGITVKK